MTDQSNNPAGAAQVAPLPCPFCGAPAEHYPDGDMEGYDVMCSAALGECKMTTFGSATAEEAEALWNRRAGPTPTVSIAGILVRMGSLGYDDQIPGLQVLREDGAVVTIRGLTKDEVTTDGLRLYRPLRIDLRAPAPPTCWCSTCAKEAGELFRTHMVLCPTCGNKRCPHANDHRHTCTGINEPGQPGSAHPASRSISPEIAVWTDPRALLGNHPTEPGLYLRDCGGSPLTDIPDYFDGTTWYSVSATGERNDRPAFVQDKPWRRVTEGGQP